MLAFCNAFFAFCFLFFCFSATDGFYHIIVNGSFFSLFASFCFFFLPLFISSVFFFFVWFPFDCFDVFFFPGFFLFFFFKDPSFQFITFFHHQILSSHRRVYRVTLNLRAITKLLYTCIADQAHPQNPSLHPGQGVRKVRG